ncbi:hypothetical protein O9992_17400 [Vibrio lentus]|nr:hypothetical protein [Vibrio lentus]
MQKNGLNKVQTIEQNRLYTSIKQYRISIVTAFLKLFLFCSPQQLKVVHNENRRSSVPVEDQDMKALDFYTNILGFIKKTEVPLGEHKWLTVVSPQISIGR